MSWATVQVRRVLRGTRGGLASATTLGQHSQTVLDTIAKAAEKRLRDTCSEVLAGMGDTLKSRLLGISDDMSAEDSDDDLPRKLHKK